MEALCVYCGSKNGRQSVYREAARTFGRRMAERNITLVFGAAGIGMMGTVANAVLEAGGRAIGIVPEDLTRQEIPHRDLTELHIVASMHERKAMMEQRADGFTALPGGLGTLEEISEILTWAQLGFHEKPCGLLNVQGYFDPLIDYLDHAVQEGFIEPPHRNLLLVEDDPERLLDRLEHHRTTPS